MIKITRLSAATDPVVHLRVEGRIVERTIDELTNACRDVLGDGKPVLLDLAGVGFVDGAGVQAIVDLSEHDVTTIGCTGFVSAILRAHTRPSTDGPETDNDEPLLAGLRAEEPAAFERMVRRYGPPLLAVARRLLRNEDDARDAVQEAFLSAFRAIGTFQGGAPFVTWLHRLVTHAALMRLRTGRERPEESVDALLPRFDDTGHFIGQVDALETPGNALTRPELHAGVRRCIDQLPESYRVILLLRDCEDLDTDEIAAALGTTASAVRSRLHQARQALRTLLVDGLGTGRHAAASSARPPEWHGSQRHSG